ncbi:MAG: cytochrome c oxidase subunit II [Gammaproteobacteria bacterium]|nr:cytochrome c oxidase subunit II [Gammaproteobacteria bacterium]MDH3935560.1 cytochrome c oxidase subunit II [Gammaproteobacteria bacterium]MDH3970877.1 cytochrome c oxidase subunit II [Gammaproteobacteria bacterium]
MFAKTLKGALYSLWGAVLLLGAGNSYAEYPINLTRGVTDISNKVFDLHMLIFWICVVACVLVFAVLIYSIFTHRKSKGAVAAEFHESTTVEIIWTTIPFLVLVAMAVPATTTLLELEDTRDSDLSIQITGYQWKWKYDYLDEGISFFSVLTTPRDQIEGDAPKGDTYLMDVDNPIVVPINKKIRFLITSNDVIHSWWVPDLGWKQDAVPGFINDAWTELKEPGTYRGKCAELCGKDHGFMPIVLVAKTQEDYDAWVEEQKGAAAAAADAATATLTMEELMARGEAAYNTSCAACHQANGAGIPGVFPAIAGSAIATGDVAKHIDIGVNGVPGTAMQAFGEQLSAVDLAAVITYQRNAFGNDTGDMVQPADIVADK